MPATGKKTTIMEDGVDKEAYSVIFTNGALRELEDLKDSLEAPDLDSVLRIAIGLIKRVEQRRALRSLRRIRLAGRFPPVHSAP